MIYPFYFRERFSLVQSLSSYISASVNSQFVILDKVHVATPLPNHTKQDIPEMTDDIEMNKILDTLEHHLKQHHVKQELSRTHLGQPEWDRLLDIIGATKMADLLLNYYVFIELPRDAIQQISGPLVSMYATEASTSHGKRKHPSDQEDPEDIEGPQDPEDPNDDEPPPMKKPKVHTVNNKTFSLSRNLYARPSLKTDNEPKFIISTIGLFDDMVVIKKLPQNNENSMRLLKGLFLDDPIPGPPIPEHLERLVKIFYNIVEEHPRYSLLNLLNAKCPRKNGNTPDRLMIHHKQVTKFIMAVVDISIPMDLFGSEHNRKTFNKILKKFVLLKKNDAMRGQDFQNGFQYRDCGWLAPSEDSTFAKRKESLVRCYFWLFDKYISNIIRTFFYVTEYESHGQSLRYYRHDDWLRITRTFVHKSLRDRFIEVDEEYMKELQLGSSPLRLIPKNNEFRIITQMNMAVKVKQDAEGDTIKTKMNNNKVLENVKLVLDFELARQGNIMETGTTSINSVIERLVTFKNNDGGTQSGQPRFYFSKMDIRHCFDTINQQKLLGSLQHIFLNEYYTIHTYETVQKAGENIITLFRKVASAPETSVDDSIEDHGKYAARSIVTPIDIEPQFESGRSVWALIKEHIQQNIITFEGKFYQQKVGIPTGSTTTTALCNLTLDVMESELLSQYKDSSNGLLLRYVDDYLFLSADKTLVREFEASLINGLDEYGFHMNPAKKENNLDSPVSEVAWCGMKISTNNLDVYHDYSSYSWESIIASTAVTTTVQWDNIKGKCIRILQQGLQRNNLANNSVNAQYRVIYESSAHCGGIMASYFLGVQNLRGAPVNDQHLIGAINDVEKSVLVSNDLDRTLVKGLIALGFYVMFKSKHVKEDFPKIVDELKGKVTTKPRLYRMLKDWPEIFN